jgi:hypothetical protein
MNKKIKKFTKKISVGLKQEYHETKQIPKQIKDKKYKEATHQVLDIGKMLVISAMWILPAGGVISAFVMKFSNKIRPSAFQDKIDANN